MPQAGVCVGVFRGLEGEMNDYYEWYEGNHIRGMIVAIYAQKAVNMMYIALKQAEFIGNFWEGHGAIMDAMGRMMVEIEPRI